MKISVYQVVLCILILAILFCVAIVFITVYKNNFAPKNTCLEEIAREYCEEQGFYFDGIGWFIYWQFHCKEDLRKSGYGTLDFFEEEIKDCKEVNKK